MIMLMIKKGLEATTKITTIQCHPLTQDQGTTRRSSRVPEKPEFSSKLQKHWIFFVIIKTLTNDK